MTPLLSIRVENWSINSAFSLEGLAITKVEVLAGDTRSYRSS